MMMPRAVPRAAAEVSMSATVAWTPSSRIRRAMRWQYWPPALRTTIWLTAPRPLPRTPQLLGLLEDLALRLDRRSNDQLRLLQLANRLGAHGAHARADGAHQVQGAVLGERRPEEDLLERSGGADPDARAARQVAVRRGHAPVIALAGRLVGTGEGRADHDRVGTGRERLAHVAARRHAAVGDDRDVPAGALVMEVARRGGVGGGGHLRHAEAEHLAARARRTRPDADEEPVGADFHQLEARLVGDDVADHEGDGQLLLELARIDGRVLGRDVSSGGDRGLHHEDVGARLLRDLTEPLGALRYR